MIIVGFHNLVTQAGGTKSLAKCYYNLYYYSLRPIAPSAVQLIQSAHDPGLCIQQTLWIKQSKTIFGQSD